MTYLPFAVAGSLLPRALLGLKVACHLPGVRIFGQELIPTQSLLLAYGVVIRLRRCLSLLFQSRKCLPTSSLGPSPIPPVRVDLAELREILGPPSLRIRQRLGFRCRRVDRFQDYLRQTVGLRLDVSTGWSISQRVGDTLSNGVPWGNFEKQSWLDGALREVDVEPCFDCPVTRTMLRVVNPATQHTRC